MASDLAFALVEHQGHVPDKDLLDAICEHSELLGITEKELLESINYYSKTPHHIAFIVRHLLEIACERVQWLDED
jgi:hypothetical protein